MKQSAIKLAKRLPVILTFDLDEENSTRYAFENQIFGITDPDMGYFALTEGYQPVLNLLENYKIQATFFIIGASVERYAATLQKIFTNNHEIGNHSFSHQSYRKHTRKVLLQEIEKTNTILEQHIGKRPYAHRSPYWHGHPDLLDVLKEMSFLWNGDGPLNTAREHQCNLRHEANGLLSIKATSKQGDWTNFMVHKMSADAVYQLWCAELEKCWKNSDVFCLVCHPFIIGRNEYFPALERFVRHVAEQPERFLFITGQELCGAKKPQDGRRKWLK